MEGQPGMLAASFQILTSDQVDMAVRQAAAIYVKNRIARAWDSTPNRLGGTAPIPEDDRAAVRGSILSTIAVVPTALRVHIASSIHSIARYDFPEQWPTLLDEINKLLASAQEADIYAGVRALLETVRSFRFADSDTKLEQVVAATFPQLLTTTKALMDSPQSQLPAVGEIVYYALKTYKTSMVITLTQHQQSQDSIVPWGTVLLRVAQKELDDAALASDPEAREATSWWKAKKWAFFSLNKLFSRYGIPSQLAPGMRSYKAFAETFLNSFAPEILKAYLQICEAALTQQQWLSRPVTRYMILFFQEWCVSLSDPASSPSRSGCSSARTCASLSSRLCTPACASRTRTRSSGSSTRSTLCVPRLIRTRTSARSRALRVSCCTLPSRSAPSRCLSRRSSLLPRC